jgi:hypothetical protein
MKNVRTTELTASKFSKFKARLKLMLRKDIVLFDEIVVTSCLCGSNSIFHFATKTQGQRSHGYENQLLQHSKLNPCRFEC